GEGVDGLGQVLAWVAEGGFLVGHVLADGVCLLYVGGAGEGLGRRGCRRSGGGRRGGLRGCGRGGRRLRRADRAGSRLASGTATGGEGEGPGEGGEEDTGHGCWRPGPRRLAPRHRNRTSRPKREQ